MVRLLLVFWVFGTSLIASAAAAQQNAWVQVEARQTLSEAEARAREYASALSDVNGFRLGSGWYALALGPYTEAQARARLLELRAAGIIPRDSYVGDGRSYGPRFFPAGGAAAVTPAPTPPATPAAPAVVAATPEAPDETPREARRSEAQLSREERIDIQRHLQWFGYYRAALDGAFGRGTRGSMSDWQGDSGFEVTGILTTRQRAALADAYDTALAELGLEKVTDQTAGISITMPARLVEFEKYDPPFVHYKPKDDSGIRVLLISQYGDRDTLGGLYEIMQTLEIVPQEGARSRTPDRFVLTGQDDSVHSHTVARLESGQIKGFTLVFPPDRASDMARVIDIMETSLESLGVALDPALGAANEQAIDLISGLELRKPQRTGSGFFVDPSGRAITLAATVAGCERISLDQDFHAEITASDDTFALLEPKEVLVPIGYARLSEAAPRLRSEVAVAGYSYGGQLSGPTVTYGALEDLRGLDGDEAVLRLRLAALDGDAGGPLLANTGTVAGMLLPRTNSTRALPDATSFAAKHEALAEFLAQAGINIARDDRSVPLAAEDLTRRASDMTVLVSCW